MRLPIPFPLRRGSEAISPTAHYTGHVWVRNGLSHPRLATLEGRLFFDALTPGMTVSRALGGDARGRVARAASDDRRPACERHRRGPRGSGDRGGLRDVP